MGSLDSLIAPKSVAIVGASTTPGSLGRRTFDDLHHRSKCAGELYPISRKAEQIDGVRRYPDVESIPPGPIGIVTQGGGLGGMRGAGESVFVLDWALVATEGGTS